MPTNIVRKGDLCSIKMLRVLQRLRDAHQAGDSFLCLDDIHKSTLTALQNRDWIVASRIHNHRTRYAITGRGLKACALFETPKQEYSGRRWDGICPECNQRPRGKWGTGTEKPYCDECQTVISRRRHYRNVRLRLKAIIT